MQKQLENSEFLLNQVGLLYKKYNEVQLLYLEYDCKDFLVISVNVARTALLRESGSFLFLKKIKV